MQGGVGISNLYRLNVKCGGQYMYSTADFHRKDSNMRK